MISSELIHPSAIIDNESVIGDNTRIWHFSHIMSGAVIGSHCNIGQNVVICSGARLGNHVKVQNNVSIYDGVFCEDYVFIGPSAVFTNVINPRSAIPRKSEYKSTIVKKGATIGANATVICGIQIGSFAFIGAGAVVTKDVKAFALVLGNPARQRGWISEHGYKLKFNSKGEAECAASGELYQLRENSVIKLFVSHHNS